MPSLHSSSLGSLALFPLELRQMIWNEFCFPPDTRDSYKSLVLTSKAMRNEFLDRLAHTTLKIDVSHTYTRDQWLTFSSSQGHYAHVNNLADAFKRGFGNIWFDKLKEIQITVSSPPEVAGVMCVSLKCRDAAKLLTRGRLYGATLPNVTVRLIDSKGSSWLPEIPDMGEWNQFPQILEHNTLFRHESVLLALSQLRLARCAKLELPLKLSKWVEKYDPLFTQDYVDVFERRYPEDQHKGGWPDQSLEYEHERAFMEMEAVLDGLSLDIEPNNPLIAMLRLERFSAWYQNQDEFDAGKSAYDTDVNRVLHINNFSQKVFENGFEEWRDRHMEMKALNPGSLLHQYGSYDDWDSLPWVSENPPCGCVKKFCEQCYASNPSVLEAYRSGLIAETWSRESWFEAYPKGIPEGFGDGIRPSKHGHRYSPTFCGQPPVWDRIFWDNFCKIDEEGLGK